MRSRNGSAMKEVAQGEAVTLHQLSVRASKTVKLARAIATGMRPSRRS
jgi:hypothetical protein